MIVFAAIVPHPPESIPGIGNQESREAISKTLDSFEKLRIELEQVDPEIIVVISPHAHLEKYSFVINSSTELKGSFARFGLDEAFKYKNNIQLAEKLGYSCSLNELPTRLREDFLDYGALIPLYHLAKNISPQIIHLSFSLMDYSRHYKYGGIIQKIMDGEINSRVAIIASADLSHRLNEDSPAGFSPTAQEFDHKVIRYLGANDETSLMGMEMSEIEEAAECGLRSIIILLGILHGKKHEFKLLSYEGPFGVGYLTARLF
jgi:aromatic ring-opening dioxygenase LigB subunit